TVGCGPMWLDRRDGTLIEASWRLPDHDGYRDVSQRFVAEETPGAKARRALLVRHHAAARPLTRPWQRALIGCILCPA
ncbi:hypothetical protein NL463_30580, partial [Klebsiella pneumoniae]|nr:hypothetical protein [Klebsiella pneumoniae]